jgi:hypothetical protein
VKATSWPAILMLCGVVAIFVAPLIVGGAPAHTFWTEEDQTQYQKASADFHAASYGLPNGQDGSSMQRSRGGLDPIAAKAKYEATKAAWEKQKARLENAQARQSWLLWGTRLLGAALACVGIYGYVRGQQKKP